ncbi:hypothetical protein TBLA_0A06340 [Henningerozyma blattae CBS 6284]|uniref:Endoplasmic reticulum transmembrane protein n=1 Tax=Henningerozyma blattae (strain ATCC 34711 / CBS 6284 / DSM 70876 / NBRC 10599 / NRRL Y-10934 / UCD 77-7) TaxID=1071380 RepID=I2GWC3_HENB6|nr:hypothetical protein TBLA_0A06340 [Tetrapisispora blattae CBS 6284]CCH58425.1 hypothetical protein TBLA_0A06340 [Tetrapisispora blattae CBS 6284]
MSLYYALVFCILVVEVVAFTLLALPLPARVRRPLASAAARPFRQASVQVAAKCVAGFVLLLFLDATARAHRLGAQSAAAGHVHGAERAELLSRRFLAQRNMYLTGFTLFLSFTVARTSSLVAELMDLRAAAKSDTNSKSTTASSASIAESLRAKLKAADLEIETLKSRAATLST